MDTKLVKMMTAYNEGNIVAINWNIFDSLFVSRPKLLFVRGLPFSMANNVSVINH